MFIGGTRLSPNLNTVNHSSHIPRIRHSTFTDARANQNANHCHIWESLIWLFNLTFDGINKLCGLSKFRAPTLIRWGKRVILNLMSLFASTPWPFVTSHRASSKIIRSLNADMTEYPAKIWTSDALESSDTAINSTTRRGAKNHPAYRRFQIQWSETPSPLARNNEEKSRFDARAWPIFARNAIKPFINILNHVFSSPRDPHPANKLACIAFIPFTLLILHRVAYPAPR